MGKWENVNQAIRQLLICIIRLISIDYKNTSPGIVGTGLLTCPSPAIESNFLQIITHVNNSRFRDPADDARILSNLICCLIFHIYHENIPHVISVCVRYDKVLTIR